MSDATRIVDVEFDAWFDDEGGVWIAESRTPRFGICADGGSREALAAKLETMTFDVAEALFGRVPDAVRIAIRWTVNDAIRHRPAA